ncbi:MAG: hypothetical protein K8L99_30645 [Anaerolineae bacterium]|jgi:hypothetical protein|nr:hypothetical protein [Anaerolineae bacterium]
MRKYVFIVLLAVFGLTFVLLAAQDISLSNVGRADPTDSAPVGQITLAAGSEAAFNYLALQRTNICGLQPEMVVDYADDAHLQGSCCAPMDLHRYQEQVGALRQYADIAQIPEDPYDMPATLVKELLGYQSSIQLTAQQQAVYDEAMILSEEGGPCCCRCWRWYAFEGMGKYLITQQGWEAEALAELWSLTDGCGGEGHGHA